MYVQVKSACGIKYVYVVESFRKSNGSISHRIVKSMGRYDDLIKDDPEALNKLKEDVKDKNKIEKTYTVLVDETKQTNKMNKQIAKINYLYREINSFKN